MEVNTCEITNISSYPIKLSQETLDSLGKIEQLDILHEKYPELSFSELRVLLLDQGRRAKKNFKLEVAPNLDS